MIRWRRFLGRSMLLAMIPLAAAGCHRHRHHDASEAEIQERVRDGAEWVLDGVDASDDQEARINLILDAAVSELVALRGQRRALATELAEALERDTVDRAVLESIRSRGVDLVDQASSVGTRALADAADVLTVEQRRKLVARARKHHGG